jgi:hypothetical protein
LLRGHDGGGRGRSAGPGGSSGRLARASSVSPDQPPAVDDRTVVGHPACWDRAGGSRFPVSRGAAAGRDRFGCTSAVCRAIRLNHAIDLGAAILLWGGTHSGIALGHRVAGLGGGYSRGASGGGGAGVRGAAAG